jgi:hypothetical protein|tara:strand:- start:861 stop:1037 length:177 start_codon:yes stop_codon:yes gene_type:complete
MDEETKLLLALYQVEGITKLTQDNEWKNFIYGHLSAIEVELQRQLSLLKHDKKIIDKD